MAYTNTVLQDALYKATLTDVYQSSELRKSNYGALEAARESTSLLLPASTIESIRKAETQTESVTTFQREADGTGTDRACSGTGIGTTAVTDVTWSTLMEEFTVSAAESLGNQYNYQEMFNNLFMQRLRSLYTRIDALVVAQLEASFAAGDGTKYLNYNGAKQVPLNDHDAATNRAAFWINYMKAEMRQNDYSNNLMLVGDSMMSANTSALINQGVSTATNTAFQYGGLGWNFTNGITNNTGRDATAYVFQKGQIGLLNWTSGIYNGTDWGTEVWSTFKDPVYGFDLELKVNRSCTDNSGSFAGAEADRVESFVISADFATPVAYSSTANTGIYKYELDDDNTPASGSGSYS
jgi:hypothetical protein